MARKSPENALKRSEIITIEAVKPLSGCTHALGTRQRAAQVVSRGARSFKLRLVVQHNFTRCFTVAARKSPENALKRPEIIPIEAVTPVSGCTHALGTSQRVP